VSRRISFVSAGFGVTPSRCRSQSSSREWGCGSRRRLGALFRDLQCGQRVLYLHEAGVRIDCRVQAGRDVLWRAVECGHKLQEANRLGHLLAKGCGTFAAMPEIFSLSSLAMLPVSRS